MKKEIRRTEDAANFNSILVMLRPFATSCVAMVALYSFSLATLIIFLHVLLSLHFMRSLPFHLPTKNKKKGEECHEMHEKVERDLGDDWGEKCRSESGRFGEAGFSATEEQTQVYDRRSALREGLLEIWRVHINWAMRMCDDRHIEVGASEVSLCVVVQCG